MNGVNDKLKIAYVVSFLGKIFVWPGAPEVTEREYLSLSLSLSPPLLNHPLRKAAALESEVKLALMKMNSTFVRR